MFTCPNYSKCGQHRASSFLILTMYEFRFRLNDQLPFWWLLGTAFADGSYSLAADLLFISKINVVKLLKGFQVQTTYQKMQCTYVDLSLGGRMT